ncbi:hypothetical protein D9M70_337130 [compost metagenome]
MTVPSKNFYNNYLQVLVAIEYCERQNLLLPALIMTYSAIDSVSWLAAGSSKDSGSGLRQFATGPADRAVAVLGIRLVQVLAQKHRRAPPLRSSVEGGTPVRRSGSGETLRRLAQLGRGVREAYGA